MDTTPPGKSTSRELVERVVEAGLGSVPLAGNALAVTFVTAVNWRLNQRREEWFTELADGVEELRQRVDGLSLDDLADKDLFVDAVVSATRTIEHTHQAEKVKALRNAVLNSVSPDAPDADTQAIFLSLVDRFTPSHLRLLALWDNPPAWFESTGLPLPTSSGNRAATVEAGLPEMRGRGDLIVRVADELHDARLLGANLTGMVSPQGMMQRLTTEFGRRFLRFISPPAFG